MEAEVGGVVATEAQETKEDAISWKAAKMWQIWTKKGDCWELDAHKEKCPNGYRAHGENANEPFYNDHDDSIEFVMVAVPETDR
jgi:hypothetical protein